MRARWSFWIAWGFAALLTSAMLLRLIPVCRHQLAAPFDLFPSGAPLVNDGQWHHVGVNANLDSAWGSRTLAGNDNEWRYVPVRRLFLMVEESLRRGTAALVWEPNDANTWIKTKAQIERFLSGLWRQGALAGAKPEQAFFVDVGLGSTMTPQDILSGRLLINVGLAPVRPAEFIILRFSLKLQEA